MQNRGQRKPDLGSTTTGKKGTNRMSEVNDTPYGDTLGTARRTKSYDQDSPEWHELRATGIGGSEVAAVVGCSPWTSAFTLWAQKTKRIEREQLTSEAAEWGTRLEEVIRQKFAESHPELTVYNDKSSWANVDRPWQLSNVDGFYEDAVGNKGIIEIKTAAYEDDWKDGQGNWVVPEYYKTQVQWYLQTFGFDHAWVVVLFAGRKYVEIECPASPFQQETNLIEVERFRKYWLEDRQPDWDGSTSTLETVRKMNPDISPDAEVELGDLGLEYLNEVEQLEIATAKMNLIKSRVLDAMGRAKRGTIGGAWRLTRQARNGGTPYLVNKKG